MTLILYFIILTCFGSIAAAAAYLLGVHHPGHIWLAGGIGMVLPPAGLLSYAALRSHAQPPGEP